MFHAISHQIGLPEPALRFFVTLMMAYPVSIGYRKYYLTPNVTYAQRNLAVLGAGLALSWMFHEFTIIHSIVTVLLTYSAYTFIHNRLFVAISIAAINTGYLLAGYKFASTDGYDINWLTPQCILCLRLMGLGMDIYDGKFVKGKDKKDTNDFQGRASPRVNLAFDDDCPLVETPTLAELFGYSFFFGGFLAGPQFSFALYKRFLSMTSFIEKDSNGKENVKVPSATGYAVKALVIGLGYMMVQQILGPRYPTSFTHSGEFAQLPFLQKMFYIWVSGKLTLAKVTRFCFRESRRSLCKTVLGCVDNQ
jgi:lysophospholipid acyltransferase 5